MIPQLLHFVWIGERAIPEWAERNIEEFRRLNPGYEVRVHGEEALLPRYADAYARCDEICQKADLLRYSVLEQSGGWYFDTDFWPLWPLDEIARAWELDGRRMFVTAHRPDPQGRPWLANGVLAAPTDWPGWEHVHAKIEAAEPPYGYAALGPCLVTALVQEHTRLFEVAGHPWFYPVRDGRAGRLYQLCRQGDNRPVRRAADTGGQQPCAMHLWAGGRPEITVYDRAAEHLPPLQAGPWDGLRVCFAMLGIQWEDETQPFQAITEGLRNIGCHVERWDVADEPIELDTCDLLVVWNGRKLDYARAVDVARQAGIPVLRIEHGFWDRRAYTQADHAGILHWASWADRLDQPAPSEGAERLARFYPDGLAEFGNRDGYVLVLGQLPGDSQMDDSELNEPTTLDRMVLRTLPDGVENRFRPHPRDNVNRPPFLPRCEADSLEEAVAGARFAVMINSNAGNECLAWGCPVLAFGPALYTKAGVALRCTTQTRGSDLPPFYKALETMLDGWRPDADRVRNYLEWLAARQWNQAEWREGEVLDRLLTEAMG